MSVSIVNANTILYQYLTYTTPTISIGIQTVVLRKDISVQCSLLPAPPLSFGRTLDSRPEVDTDSETDEIMTEIDESDRE